MHDALGTATRAVESVEEALEAAAGTLARAVSAMAEKLEKLSEDARARLDETRARFADAADAHASALEDATGALVAGKDALLGDFTARLEAVIEQRLSTAAGESVAGIEALGAALDQAAQAARGEHADLSRSLPEVRDRIPPLQCGVVSVRAAADHVGLSWN
jgi:N-acetylglucosamine-6-phosphate deacetylase